MMGSSALFSGAGRSRMAMSSSSSLGMSMGMGMQGAEHKDEDSDWDKKIDVQWGHGLLEWKPRRIRIAVPAQLLILILVQGN